MEDLLRKAGGVKRPAGRLGFYSHCLCDCRFRFFDLPAFTTKLPRQTICDHPEESAPTMPALVNGAVHFKVIQAVHFILIYPVHLIVIWAVHLKCCNHQLISHYSTQCVVTLTHVSRPVV